MYVKQDEELGLDAGLELMNSAINVLVILFASLAQGNIIYLFLSIQIPC